MILLLSDIHGDYFILQDAINKAHQVSATCIIQLGDFGLFDKDNGKDFHRVCQSANIPVYFIEGNHDDCSRWTALTEVTKIWDDANLFYIPRGTVMEIDGRTLAFMGGAWSIDKNIRLQHNMHWDEREDINDQEVERLIQNSKDKKIDMFITHCPPNSVISEHFDPNRKLQFGVGLDWHDRTQDIIENLWIRMGYPKVYSGHMHSKIQGENYRILNINELLAV